MKILKVIWFLISVGMIGVSGYFLYTNNQQEKPESNEKIVDKNVTTVKSLTYMNDTIGLINGVSEADAGLIMSNFESSLNNSWFWMPDTQVSDLSKLDNEYRLTITSYKIVYENAKNTTSKKYPTTTINNKEVMTKTQFKVAWEDIVGLDVVLTDGNPCSTLKYCDQYFKYNTTQDYYEVNKPYTANDSNYKTQFISLTKNSDEYTLKLKAVYAEYDDVKKMYTVYTTPNKLMKITELLYDKAVSGTDLDLFNSSQKTELLASANTYEYTFKLEGGNPIFTGYNIIKK